MNATARPAHPLASLRDSFLVRRRVSAGRSVRVLGRVWVHGQGTIVLADDVVLDARAAPIELHAHGDGEIRIGRGAIIESGASLEATDRIVIGANATLGPFVKVMDNHFHPLDEQHRLPPSRPVVISEGATIGPRAILLPGAWIAPGATVPTGAVVSRRFGAAGEAEAGSVEQPRSERRPPMSVSRGPAAKARAAMAIARAMWYLRGCERGRHVHVGGPVMVANRGDIRIGAHAVFVGGMIPTAMACGPGASIEIGEGTILNYGVSLDSTISIEVGSGCRFGSLVRVSDHGATTGRIVIGNDVWIAHGATIEPGVTIGSGSVISAGSRVTSHVPANSLAIGSPARCMSLEMRPRDRAPEPRSISTGGRP